MADDNNNPGNLENSDGTLKTFDTPAEGYQGIVNDITSKVSGNSKPMIDAYGANYTPTLNNMIAVYAPKKDNNDPKASLLLFHFFFN